MTLFFSFQFSFGQDKSEIAYKQVIKQGLSTGPSFVVVTIKNANTGQTKDLITDVISFYQAIEKETNETSYDKIEIFLLTKSNNRTFELKNKEALENLNFDKYQLKSADEIEKIIVKNNVINGLSKINEQREIVSSRYYEYSDQRKELIQQIKDSIGNVRQLENEELKILGDLKDQYYDYYYNEYAKISKKGRKLMKIWNTKIKPYKNTYKKYTDELERLEKKFFKDYYNKYGIYFCHVAFKYGAIFHSNCEYGLIEFDTVVK